MPFMDELESVREKTPSGRLSRPVLLGITSFALVIAVLAALGVASSARGDFIVGNTASSSSAATEIVQDDQTGTVAAVREPETEQPCVYVVGAVRKPGVYTVPAGARVTDAIEAAGGFAKSADPVAVNLARPVVDGEQITIPKKGEVVSGDASDGNSAFGQTAAQRADGSSSGKVNINTATSAELEALPGIGAVTAEKIIANREAEGPFVAPDELKRVSGIGERKYEAIADLITV